MSHPGYNKGDGPERPHQTLMNCHRPAPGYLSVMRTPIALPPSPNGKERAMIKRRRFKQATSLAERLMENAEQLRQQLVELPPGPERDSLVKRIRQSETASHIENWLRSPGLRPPAGLSNLADK